MKLEKSILIIDDRQIFIQSIKLLAKTEIKERYNFKFHVSNTYKNAIKKLKHLSFHGVNIDSIFLNIEIDDENNLGFILLKKYIKNINEYYPRTKIVLFAKGTSNYRLNYIINDCKPHGFILEKDIDYNEIVTIFDTIIKQNIYYSKSVISVLKNYKHIKTKVDEINYHILYFLKMGIKSNYIQNYIPLSNSTIEKRKYKLKDEFSYGKCSDEQLVKEAIKRKIL